MKIPRSTRPSRATIQPVSTAQRDDAAIGHGTTIGRFVVIAELGRGGMGIVYAAHDPELDRQVALKVMRGAAEDDEDRLRMLREGRAMARVTHPNVITVYEVGTEGSTVFLAQELLDGGTLGQWLASPRSPAEILETFVAAGRGLAAAHAAGLVHRDFKPDNVLLGKDGRVRVADFGLARTVGAPPEALATTTRGGPPRDDLEVARGPMSPLTRTGAVMGTPRFMAPEQHRGERADARSDQFGFCVALYHALYQAWPFGGKTAVALADAVLAGRLEPPPASARVPARLHALLVHGLSRNPEARFPSMDALLAALAHVPGRRPGRVVLVGGALVLVAGTVAGGYAVVRSQAATPVPQGVDAGPPPPRGDGQAMTSDQEIAWLTKAIDRGQLDDALEKYDLAATIGLRDKDHAAASIAQSAGVFTLVLRGELAKAAARLKLATVNRGDDPTAGAYVDLATASLAAARADLSTARELSARCATEFATRAPVMAAMCHQLHGDATAAAGDRAGARRAYEEGLAIASRHASAERTSTLQLAVAQLNLDDLQRDRAAARATQLLATCRDRGAVGCEVHARILLARVRLDAGESAQALELLEAVTPATIQAVRVRISHEIGLGEVHGYMNEAGDDGVAGLDRDRTGPRGGRAPRAVGARARGQARAGPGAAGARDGRRAGRA